MVGSQGQIWLPFFGFAARAPPECSFIAA